MKHDGMQEEIPLGAAVLQPHIPLQSILRQMIKSAHDEMQKVLEANDGPLGAEDVRLRRLRFIQMALRARTLFLRASLLIAWGKCGEKVFHTMLAAAASLLEASERIAKTSALNTNPQLPPLSILVENAMYPRWRVQESLHTQCLGAYHLLPTSIHEVIGIQNRITDDISSNCTRFLASQIRLQLMHDPFITSKGCPLVLKGFQDGNALLEASTFSLCVTLRMGPPQEATAEEAPEREKQLARLKWRTVSFCMNMFLKGQTGVQILHSRQQQFLVDQCNLIMNEQRSEPFYHLFHTCQSIVNTLRFRFFGVQIPKVLRTFNRDEIAVRQISPFCFHISYWLLSSAKNTVQVALAEHERYPRYRKLELVHSDNAVSLALEDIIIDTTEIDLHRVLDDVLRLHSRIRLQIIRDWIAQCQHISSIGTVPLSKTDAIDLELFSGCSILITIQPRTGNASASCTSPSDARLCRLAEQLQNILNRQMNANAIDPPVAQLDSHLQLLRACAASNVFRRTLQSEPLLAQVSHPADNTVSALPMLVSKSKAAVLTFSSTPSMVVQCTLLERTAQEWVHHSSIEHSALLQKLNCKDKMREMYAAADVIRGTRGSGHVDSNNASGDRMLRRKMTRDGWKAFCVSL